jgi:uncharacterized RDD family membrane protein YckC
MTATVAPEQPITAAALPLRFVALAIDAGIHFVVVNLIMRATDGDTVLFAMDARVPVFTLAWAALYEVGFLLLWSATPGKRLLRMYVAGSDGERVRLLNAAVRVAAFHLFFVTFFVEGEVVRTWGWLFVVLLLTSLTMALTDPQRRALHDRIAGTMVLRGPAPGSRIED